VRTHPFEAEYSFVSFICFASSASSILAGRMGNDYIIELTPPTTEEIRNARLLATVLPDDALTHAVLIAAILCAGR
jgi:hypothetical protein